MINYLLTCACICATVITLWILLAFLGTLLNGVDNVLSKVKYDVNGNKL